MAAPAAELPVAVAKQEEEQEVQEKSPTAEKEEDDLPGSATAAAAAAPSQTTASGSALFLRTATFLNAAKERVGGAVAGAVEGASHLAKNFSTRTPAATGTDAAAPSDSSTGAAGGGAAPPAAQRQPSIVDGVVDEQHARAVTLANTIIDFSNEMSRKVEASVVKTRESTVAATWRTYQAAVQGLRRLTAPSRRVAAVVKADLRTKPAPQVLLLCCSLVASSKGLSSTNLFQEPLPAPATVEALMLRLEDRLLLLPLDVEPALAAAVIMHFLATLEEPLITYKLVDRWVAAGKQLMAEGGSVDGVHELLSNMPLTNWATLKLLVETLYRVASQSNVTGMNAQALSSVFAPLLAWREHPPPPPAAQPDASAASGGSAGDAASAASSRSAQPSSAQVVVAQASQMASATLQAIKSKIYATAIGTTPASGANATETGDAAAPVSTTTTTTAASADAPAPPLVSAPELAEPVPAPRAPLMVLDDDEVVGTSAEAASTKQETAAGHLEDTVVQQSRLGGKGGVAGDVASPTAAAVAAAQPSTAVVDGGGKAKILLEEEELQAVVHVLAQLILNYDDLFVLGP